MDVDMPENLGTQVEISQNQNPNGPKSLVRRSARLARPTDHAELSEDLSIVQDGPDEQQRMLKESSNYSDSTFSELSEISGIQTPELSSPNTANVVDKETPIVLTPGLKPMTRPLKASDNTHPVSGVFHNQSKIVKLKVPVNKVEQVSETINTDISHASSTSNLKRTWPVKKQQQRLDRFLKSNAESLNARPSLATSSGSDSDFRRNQDWSINDPKTDVLATSSVSRSKPKPCGRPLVWADTRADLCETLRNYRSWQGGAYTKDGYVHACYIGGFSGNRPYMDHEVIISRTGGGCELDENGDLTASSLRKQEGRSRMEQIVECYRNNQQQNLSILMIIGDGFDAAPVEIPHSFCVLDYFVVTDVWSEPLTAGFVYKIRFQKVHLHEQSWWAPENYQATQPVPEISPVRRTCKHCSQESAQISAEGWMCTNHKCAKFWLINGATKADSSFTEYSQPFLAYRVACKVKPPYSVRPGLPGLGITEGSAAALSELALIGLACPDCGRCNARTSWEYWKCLNCGFTHSIKLPILSWREVNDPNDVSIIGHAIPVFKASPCIQYSTKLMTEYRVQEYILPTTNGPCTVAHFQANSIINGQKGGPNDMFEEIQDPNSKVGLQRFKLKNSLSFGMFTNHFSVNYGMPYEYVVAVDSKPFKDAHPVLMRALSRLMWAKAQVAQQDEMPFNELLVVGYMEKQKMDFHDDGESTLGPTIGTLSLGGKATMTFRLKQKYWDIPKDVKHFDPEAPLFEECPAYKERLALKESWPTMMPDQRSKAIAHLASLKIKYKKDCPVLLTITIAHGDMIIMHGSDMQKYYVHKVQSEGLIRFSLTCRHVLPELIDPALHWKGEYDMDPGFIYDGDESPSELTTPMDVSV